ncbi:MAG: hypothetical protein AW07_03579 [Candidatus Accumulibacter sp. SK-11]|nr:MAG: hypothetical protein AW07_03579 [Candidatus Accumulibacter sp. SK-11]
MIARPDLQGSRAAGEPRVHDVPASAQRHRQRRTLCPADGLPLQRPYSAWPVASNMPSNNTELR